MVVGNITSTENQLRHCCAELERRLRCGEMCRAEDFFAACPELAADVESALDLIYHEYSVRGELGASPSWDEYFTRFPQWRDRLVEQSQVHTLLLKGTLIGVEGDETQAPWPTAPPRPWKNSPDNFEILEEIARGSMGVVYRAWQKSLRRVVAIKIIPARAVAAAEALARFRQEAEVIARLVHPNIVQIYTYREWENCPFLVLEFVEGGTLAAKWKGKPQPAPAAAAMILTLARAVQYANERGVVHRDLRPRNVLLTKEGEPKIIDFGLAKLMVGEDDLTMPGQVLGTPSYMAPEQAAGHGDDVGPRADVYGLGAMLYEGLTGHPPFRGHTILDTLQQVLQLEPTPPRRWRPDLPRDLETICLKCLQKVPADRYASAADLAADLHRFLTGQPIQGRRAQPVERLCRWWGRNHTVANLLLALFSALALGFSLVIWMWSEEARARGDAETARESALKEKIKVERLSAGILLNQAVNQGDHGNIDHALLLLARSLEQADANDDPALERVARINLTAFRALLVRRRASLPHADWAWAVVPSPDGKLIATASKDMAVRLWDIETGQLIGAPLTHNAPVWALAFTPDGKTLLTGSGDPEHATGAARLWSVETGQPLGARLTERNVVNLVALAADGATALIVEGNRAQLWDVTRREPLGPPLPHPCPVVTAVLSPDGKMTLTGGTDGTARLWRTTMGEAGPILNHAAAVPMPDSQAHVVTAAFSPDGRWMATGTQIFDAGRKRWVSGEVRLWRTDTGEPFGTPMVHAGPLKTVVFSPDSRRLLSGSIVPDKNQPDLRHGEARLWDVASGKQIGPALEHEGPVWSVAFSPSGRVLLSGGEKGFAKCWLAATGQRMGSFHAAGNARSVAFGSDGKSAFVGHTYTPAVADVLEVSSGWGEVLPPLHEGAIGPLVFSPDSKLLAAAGKGAARIWDLADRERSGRAVLHRASTRPIAFSPDSTLLLTAVEGHVLQMWKIATGEPVGPKLAHGAEVVVAAFSPDGKSILTRDKNHQVHLWDAATGDRRQPPVDVGEGSSQHVFAGDAILFANRRGAEVQLWDGATGKQRGEPLRHRHPVTACALSILNNLVATGTEGGSVYLWDADSGSPYGKPLPHQSMVQGLAFSPNGKLLLTWCAGDHIRLWDVTTGQPLGLPLQHPADIVDARFAPDGRTIVVASGSAAWLWDVATGKRLGPPMRHPDLVKHIAFEPNGRRFATACADRLVRFWEVPQPAQGQVSHITAWAEVLTGRTLSETVATLDEIDGPTLVNRRRELQNAGPEPFPGPGR